MCESLQSTASSQHRSLGPRNLCGTESSHRHVRHGSRTAFSVPSRRTCRQGHTTRAVPTKTEELKPGVETAEGLRLAMEPIGPVKHLGFPKDFEKHYRMGEEIGKGAWAAVYTATELSTGDKRAVKVLEKWRNKDGTIENGFAVRLRREIATYEAMSGSLNVCQFYGAFECDKHLYLVTEMCTGGQLWERVEAGRFSEAQAARIIREILQLLAQAHSRNIIIRDIKPDNLLFLNKDEDAPLKAIDFGIATVCKANENLEERCGSPVYVAPEVLKKCYGQKADVWSAGMVAYLLLCARLPWKTESADQSITFSDLYVSMGDGKSFNRKDAFAALMFSDLDFEFPPWPNLSADAKDFVQQLLQKDPAKRVTAIEALHHRWLVPEGTASARPFDSSIVQRLQNFGTFSNTKKVALRAIVSSLAHDSGLVKEVREAFEELEHGHTGSVKNATLLQGLRDKGYTLQDNEAEQLVSHLDVDFSGDVDYLDWLAAMIDWHQVQQDGDWDDRVRQAFKSLDNNQDGVLCEEDLQLPSSSQGDDAEGSNPIGSRDPLASMDLDEFTDLVDPAEQGNLAMYNRRYKSQDE